MNLQYMQTIYPLTTADAEHNAGQLDALMAFLFHHFEKELEEFKTYKEVENSQDNYTSTGFVLRHLAYDVNTLSTSVNNACRNIEHLSQIMQTFEAFENRIVKLESDLFDANYKIEVLQKEVNDLTSEQTQKQNDSDK